MVNSPPISNIEYYRRMITAVQPNLLRIAFMPLWVSSATRAADFIAVDVEILNFASF